MDYYPEQAQGGGLAGYFTSTLESSFISRRGRPPVIRAAEKVSTLLQGKHSEHSVQLISFLYWITRAKRSCCGKVTMTCRQ